MYTISKGPSTIVAKTRRGMIWILRLFRYCKKVTFKHNLIIWINNFRSNTKFREIGQPQRTKSEIFQLRQRWSRQVSPDLCYFTFLIYIGNFVIAPTDIYITSIFPLDELFCITTMWIIYLSTNFGILYLFLKN